MISYLDGFGSPFYIVLPLRSQSMCGLNGHRQFVFDVFDGSLVVIPIVEAQRLASLNDALEDSSTWREFQSCVANDAETISYLEGQYGDELPSPDDPFAPEDIPGFVEGAFPAWPQQLSLIHI